MTSLIRAVHARCDRPVIFDDPYGDRLVSDAERPALLERLLLMLSAGQREVVERCDDQTHAIDTALRFNPAYAGVIVRSRHTEDRLLSAVNSGAGQYVVIGAGLDTFSLRHPGLVARLQIFEIDTAETLAMKEKRFASADLPIQANVHFIAVDLEQQSVDDALRRSPYVPGKRTFVACLGVTPYLTSTAFDQLLRSLAACTVPESELVFDYLDPDAFSADRSDAAIRQVAAERASSGEPWRSGLDPATLPDCLRAAEWELVENLNADALQTLYYAGRAPGLRVPPHMHLARACRPSR
jgi:methyltransferase (TIGR00027 family)